MCFEEIERNTDLDEKKQDWLSVRLCASLCATCHGVQNSLKSVRPVIEEIAHIALYISPRFLFQIKHCLFMRTYICICETQFVFVCFVGRLLKAFYLKCIFLPLILESMSSSLQEKKVMQVKYVLLIMSFIHR